MASGFIYRSWTNDNRGSSGNFLFLVSVTLGLMVMFMVTKASAFVATSTAVLPGNSRFLVEEESLSQPTVKGLKNKAKAKVKHQRRVARARTKAKKSRWAAALAHFPGHSLGSQTASSTAQSVGVASWYGPGFHGRRTASGTRYDMNELTAAHKSLPFGTRLLVTNKANGRSTIVTITDRGPYIGKRVLDLSKEAARQLHMVGSGIEEVEYKIL